MTKDSCSTRRFGRYLLTGVLTVGCLAAVQACSSEDEGADGAVELALEKVASDESAAEQEEQGLAEDVALGTLGLAVTACRNSAVCNDGNACTQDRCQAGRCVNIPLNCNDNNPCTNDSCNPRAGGCTHVNNSNSCSDGNVCNGNEFCTNGSCTVLTVLNCNDNDPCTNDSCNPQTGCINVNNSDCIE